MPVIASAPRRAALIALAEPQEQPMAGLAGLPPSHWQLRLALAWGAQSVILAGPGAPGEAAALRQACEAAGRRCVSVAGPAPLIAMGSACDLLLALQPGLIAASPEGVSLLGEQPVVLAMPASASPAPGLERISQEWLWAGALIVPASLLQPLADLPEDAAAVPALLRVALQGGVPLRAAPDGLVGSPVWIVPAVEPSPGRRDRLWLEAMLNRHLARGLTGWLARRIVLALGARLAAGPWALPVVLAVMALALVAALVLAWLGQGAPGFVVLALALLAQAMVQPLASLRAAPRRPRRGWRLTMLPGDVAIMATGLLAIEGIWYRQVFAPLMLLGLLVLTDRAPDHPVRRFTGDRLLVALGLAFGVLALGAEGALALAALALLAGLLPRAGPGMR